MVAWEKLERGHWRQTRKIILENFRGKRTRQRRDQPRCLAANELNELVKGFLVGTTV